MRLVRYEPWTLARDLHQEIDRLFRSRLQDDDAGDLTTADWIPSVDIKEAQDRYLLHVDLPGVEPDSIEITMQDGTLTIRGQRVTEAREEEDGFCRVERVSGQFIRRFSLPETVDADRIEAESRHGVLALAIPKMAKAEPKRISIKAA